MLNDIGEKTPQRFFSLSLKLNENVGREIAAYHYFVRLLAILSGWAARKLAHEEEPLRKASGLLLS